MLQKKNIFPGLVRRLLLGWLLAAVLEMLLLPVELRNLDKLAGIGQMSLLRMLLVMTAAVILLTVLSHNRKSVLWERWGIVAAFAVLTLSYLWTSFTWPFFIAG